MMCTKYVCTTYGRLIQSSSVRWFPETVSYTVAAQLAQQTGPHAPRLTCPVIATKTLRPHIRVALRRIGRSSYCFFSCRNKAGVYKVIARARSAPISTEINTKERQLGHNLNF